MKALILAAGYATRLYPLTKDKPKALLPIGGKLMLDYLVNEILTIPEIDGIFIVTNHKFACQFNEWVSTRSDCPIPISVIDDMTSSNEDRLGAIGDIEYAIGRAHIDDDLLVAASDNFFTFKLDGFMNSFRKSGLDTILVKEIFDIETLKRFAIVKVDNNGKVLSLVEKPDVPDGNLAVYALYLYRRDTLPLFSEYIASGNNPDSPGHFPEWLYKRKDVIAYTFTGECVDIGTVDSYREVCERYRP